MHGTCGKPEFDARSRSEVFSNGEKDPWRTGSPRGDAVLGPGSARLWIAGAAHHEDLRFASSAGSAERAENVARNDHRLNIK